MIFDAGESGIFFIHGLKVFLLEGGGRAYLEFVECLGLCFFVSSPCNNRIVLIQLVMGLGCEILYGCGSCVYL